MTTDGNGAGAVRATVTPAADWAVAIATGLLGLLGLFAAGWARDGIFALFGWGLLFFGLTFSFGIVRGHFDRLDRALAEAGEDRP